MAEALAIVSLVSAIVQFVDFGTKVVERLNEFSSDIEELPKAFQATKVELPLLIDTLSRTKRQADAGYVSDATAIALKPLIDACLNEIKALQTILDKTLPPQKSSSWQRRLLALRSLAHDKDVNKIITKLESHIRLLTFHQSTTNSDELFTRRVSPQANSITPHQPRKPIFMVPFDRDESFVGRQDILDSIHRRINASRRLAVLSGIGGVG
jgi:N-terminal domain on NACHT_NTPase and P-loop NTPases